LSKVDEEQELRNR